MSKIISKEKRGEMKQPTQEQIRKLGEWCGLEYHDGYFYDVLGKQIIAERRFLTLDNLFKYAVPKVIEKYDLKMFSFYDDLNDKVFWFAHVINKTTNEVEFANIEGCEELKDALFEVVSSILGIG